ncbi:FUSC family protein [Microbacterium sp. A196]|uniref:FUSC family protein n=1 Tax=unclassified Microbacterium TaxID=2609290 RepID=UPI003FD0FB85
MTARSRLADVFASRDPGRARLTVAIGVAAGALASAAAGMAIIKALHADSGLLAMAIFLSVMAGNMVHDRSAAGRAGTTALMLPVLGLVIAAATLLSAYRPVLIGVFIVLTGAAIWVRRFGPRAASLGSLGFMGYFFTLFMKPTIDALPAFLLIGLTAVAAQLVVRLVLLLKRPRAEIEVLLRELRAASAAALRTASRDGHGSALRMSLARLDEVGRAIAAWQQHFPTDRFIACDEDTLAERVLDARVDTEEACYELARHAAPSSAASAHAPPVTLAHLEVLLDDHASTSRTAEATAWAEQAVTRSDQGGDFENYLVAQSTLAHARLRAINLSHGLVHDGRRVNDSASRSPKVAEEHHRSIRWLPWGQWQASSRMAVQAMIAASVASVVGEAISASRWYWAVMTAFVIFVGATTRGGILTRAYRRVAGTALGIVVGIVPVILAGHNDVILVSICVLSVFCMLYLGPLNYVYSAFSMTVMLVALYGLLGVLDTSILELRVVETVSGAAIGVICAYLIASTNSRPVLAATAKVYLDALDALLQSVSSALGSPQHSADVLSRLDALEAAQADADRAVSSMTAAFRLSRSQRETTAVHLMYITTRSAARLVQSTVTVESASATDVRAATRQVVDESIDEVRGSIAEARHSLGGADAGDQTTRSDAVLALDRLPTGASPAASAAIMALVRIDWALRQLGDDDAGSGRRSRKKSPVALPPS